MSDLPLIPIPIVIGIYVLITVIVFKKGRHAENSYFGRNAELPKSSIKLGDLNAAGLIFAAVMTLISTLVFITKYMNGIGIVAGLLAIVVYYFSMIKPVIEIYRENYADLYDGKPMDELLDIPEGTIMPPKTGLPTSPGPGKWGLLYTRYVTPSGSKYHMRGCRYGNIEIHAYVLYKRHMWPCSICKAHIPNMAWVDEYRRIESIKLRYKLK